MSGRVHDLVHEKMTRLYQGSKNLTKLKAKGKLQKVFHEAQTLALVGFYINLRIQAIADFFF